MELPKILQRGERSRLFPVLADTSKEGRTLSIFLACLGNVEEFGKAMLEGIGVRVGARTRIETYTEVVLAKGGDRKHRPDGLIVVRSGSRDWTALVEAKVGNSELTAEQLDGYMDIAKLNGVDAMLTLSNQFAPLPTHHPVDLSASTRRKAELFHWSWMFVVTQASLLLGNEQVLDRDQRFILNEMTRFLLHPSAGVKSFDQMPASWSELTTKVQAGAVIAHNSSEAKEVAGAWHQETRDLSLVLSRQLNVDVTNRISRAHASDPSARLKATVTELANNKCLSDVLVVPDAAAPVEVCADLQTRTVAISMKMRAPDDRKSTKARLNWLLRQMPTESDAGDIYIRLNWPGRTAPTQYALKALRDDPDLSNSERQGQVVLSFEVLLVKDLGARFGQRRNFITELEAAVPGFYKQIGQHLKAWQPPVPQIREGKSEPSSVAPDALRDEAEKAAFDRDS